MAVAAGSASELVVDLDTVQQSKDVHVLVRSADGGTSWAPTLTVATPSATASSPQPPRDFLGFEDAAAGHFIHTGSTIWNTDDGGATWSAYRFP